MGLDPNDDSYPDGDECVLCVDELFKGTTPNCVIAIVQDIVPCFPESPIHGTPPNGSFYLPQVGPCEWAATILKDIYLNWVLSANWSMAMITYPGFYWFKSDIYQNCFDAFPNDNECGVGPVLGEGGYITFWWGPGICKPPCS